MKAMLASDYEESKLRFPLIAQPKIDGVRALNMDGTLLGRSGKKHANRYVTRLFSSDVLKGFDGEMAAASEVHPSLCRLTSSAMSSIFGEPFTQWWLFDYVTPQTIGMDYYQRLDMLYQRVQMLRDSLGTEPCVQRLMLIPFVLCKDMETLLKWDTQWLDEGYEGTIIRDPSGKHKQGRSTVREGGLLRIKRFIEEEAVVTGLVEGLRNENEAQINELGLQFRTTHQENMVPNGQVGTILATNVKDGKPITVSPGKMPVDERVRYWQNQHLLLGQTIKYKHFPKGVKDKPRFPTFQTIRMPSDM